MSGQTKQPYYIKVTVEAGCDDSDTPYQETIFMQRYETNEQQVSEQVALFPALAETVVSAMVATANVPKGKPTR